MDGYGEVKADSMLILVITSVILVFGLLFVMISALLNYPIDDLNQRVSAGEITQGTSDAAGNILQLWRVTPFFVVVALGLYAFERSKGTGLPATTFFEYMGVMVLGIMLSLILVWGMGILFDRSMSSVAVIDTGQGPWANVSATWGATTVQYYLSRVMYIVLMLPAYLCSILFIFHPLIMQTGTSEAFDSLARAGEEEESEFQSSYSPNMKQF